MYKCVSLIVICTRWFSYNELNFLLKFFSLRMDLFLVRKIKIIKGTINAKARVTTANMLFIRSLQVPRDIWLMRMYRVIRDI